MQFDDLNLYITFFLFFADKNIKYDGSCRISCGPSSTIQRY